MFRLPTGFSNSHTSSLLKLTSKMQRLKINNQSPMYSVIIEDIFCQHIPTRASYEKSQGYVYTVHRGAKCHFSVREILSAGIE